MTYIHIIIHAMSDTLHCAVLITTVCMANYFVAHSIPSGLNSDILPPIESPIQRAYSRHWITSTAAPLPPPPIPTPSLPTPPLPPPPLPQYLSDHRMWQPHLRPVDWVNLIGQDLANACAWIGYLAMDTQRSQVDIPMVSPFRGLTVPASWLMFLRLGTVCVWDLLSSFLRSHTPATPLIHPLLQVAAHTAPCRCVSWCPLDGNYIFTGTVCIPHTHIQTHTHTHTHSFSTCKHSSTHHTHINL